MHICIKMQYFCKSLRKSRSALCWPAVNNTARERRQGAESPHSEGEITYTELFCPTTVDPIPVFSQKMSPRRCQDVVFGVKTPWYRGKDAQFLRKNQSWTEILIPSHDKMAAVDSFDTKKFFSFPDRPWRGRGSAITPYVKTPPLLTTRGSIAPLENNIRKPKLSSTISKIIAHKVCAFCCCFMI